MINDSVEFTRSAVTDTKATVTTNRLSEFSDIDEYVSDGETFNLTFKKGKATFTTTFTASRGGRTLYGPLPAGFRMPTVGRSLKLKVVALERINNG